MSPRISFLCRLSLVLLGPTLPGMVAAAGPRPNIILIMADDMGFSDLGCYGGEIRTPHLDSLAAGGVRFAEFYNSGRCCPTRATLLTGLHPHQTGIGHMTETPQGAYENRPPAYAGYLNRSGVTLAEALQPAGYATLMTGKWHLGYHGVDRWPLQRGFQKFYGCISGATNYFDPRQPRGITLGNDIVTDLESTTDRRYYTTDAFTDYAIQFIGEHLDNKDNNKENPFFLYLAYTAPHWPIQAHEEDIDKYRERYKTGWDLLREERYRKQLALELIDPACALSPRDGKVPAWDSLDEAQKSDLALRMAVYAAMIDRLDQNVGRLVASLKERGVFENTLILFLSDNGACAEGGLFPKEDIHDIAARNASGGIPYGHCWANASSTPFRLYKHFTHEGGTATPFFAHWPAGIPKQADWYRQPAQLIDIMPTLLDLSGAEYPATRDGEAILPLDGVSLLPAFTGGDLNRKSPIFIEHEGNASVRDGDWKLVGRGVTPPRGLQPAKWELYNIREDRTELHDLAEAQPEKVRELSARWSAWAERAQVYPKPGSPLPNN